MTQITLDIPNSLHQRLEGLAQLEGVQPAQYIMYILMQWTGRGYIAYPRSEEDVAQQKANYMARRQSRKILSPEQVREVLAKRTEVEPEPDLKPETVKKIRQRIAEQHALMNGAVNTQSTGSAQSQADRELAGSI